MIPVKRPIQNRDWLKVKGPVAGKRFVISVLGGWGEMFSALWAAQSLEKHGAKVLFVVRTWSDDSFLHMATGVSLYSGCTDHERSVCSDIGVEFYDSADYYILLDGIGHVGPRPVSVYEAKLLAVGLNPDNFEVGSMRPNIMIPPRIADGVPRLPKEFVAIHYRTDHLPKSLDPAIVQQVVNRCPLPTVIIGADWHTHSALDSGDNSIVCRTHKFADAVAIMAKAKAAICIDSSLSHAGHALRTPMVVIYNKQNPPKSQLQKHALNSKYIQVDSDVDWMIEANPDEIVCNLMQIL